MPDITAAEIAEWQALCEKVEHLESPWTGSYYGDPDTKEIGTEPAQWLSVIAKMIDDTARAYGGLNPLTFVNSKRDGVAVTVACTLFGPSNVPVTQFIAAARSALPRLLAAYEEQQREIERLRKEETD